VTGALPEGFWDHFRRPRCVGRLDPCDREWERQSPYCADRIRFTARFRGRRVEEVRFLAQGCSVLIAAASAAAEAAAGKPLAELIQRDVGFLLEALGPLPARKRRCAAFAWSAMQDGLRGRDPIPEEEE